MSVVYPRPPRRAIVFLDLALALWLAAWVLFAFAVAREANGIARLGTTVVLAGGAIEQTGRALGTLEAVPLVGGSVGDLAGRIEATGTSARRNARVARESVESLSLLLGLAVGLIPTVPLLVLYVPIRLAWRREAEVVRRALRSDPPDPFVEQFLAWRAALSLPYPRLRAVSDDPWRDLAERRYRALADAELERLGLSRPGGGRPRA